MEPTVVPRRLFPDAVDDPGFRTPRVVLAHSRDRAHLDRAVGSALTTLTRPAERPRSVCVAAELPRSARRQNHLESGLVRKRDEDRSGSAAVVADRHPVAGASSSRCGACATARPSRCRAPRRRVMQSRSSVPPTHAGPAADRLSLRGPRSFAIAVCGSRGSVCRRSAWREYRDSQCTASSIRCSPRLQL